MNDFPLVVTFHTNDRFYTEEVQGLLKSCERFGMQVHVECLKNTGSWTQNCALKGPFVKKCMARFQRPLLWLDADAVVVKKPELFAEINVDFAAYLHRDQELISSTCFFNHTPKAMELIDEWAVLCDRDKATWDQKHLQRAEGSVKPNTFWLPHGYAKVCNRSCDTPIYVVQNQASRRFKKLINRGLK